MKLKIVILFLLTSTFLVSITLQECISNLEKNYPTSENEQLYNAIGGEEISHLNKTWLPQLFLTGSVSYSSETTEFDLDLPPTLNIDFPKAEKDRETVSMEISQKVFDAGVTAKQKKFIRLGNLVDLTNHQALTHQKKILVTTIYLNVALLNETRTILELQLKDLNVTKQMLQARVKQGLLEQSDVQKLEYEILNLQDTLDEIDSNKISLMDYLSLLTGMNIDKNAVLDIPEEPEINNDQILRKELQGFELQKQLLSASQKLNSRSLWPQLLPVVVSVMANQVTTCFQLIIMNIIRWH